MGRSPSLSLISLGYCIIVLFIIMHDLGYNCLMLKYSLLPESYRKTALMVASVFVVCSPVFVIYAFEIFGCLYFFHPQNYTYYFRRNLCFDIHRIAEWICAGFFLSTSIVADILIALSLFKQRKRSGMDTFKDVRDFSFMIQTLVLSLANGFSMLYLYTLGSFSTGKLWLDHVPKLLDLVLALTYT
ncbi:hypothetical protein Y032_0013g2091 [Ancylostoma ceylanicum]|uniref:7TM GPCR serpentine receptor class x (Srx) domain-containing protein n=1 Tax=Ancylostoma ceylanicum TaxID=53326 RepID=A0A016VBV6_9BILA|nr:hypothetical protein Y032_0013g2091 [Ancylostoma ceylanicum]